MENFDEMHIRIAKNLEFLRKNEGLSLEQIGMKLGISKSGYRKLEKGDAQISLRHLHSLSTIYRVPLMDMLFTDLSTTSNSFVQD